MALTDNLISYWKFDETSGTTADDAHGANDGTVVNATINQAGKIDRCYTFDGAGDYVSLPNSIISSTSSYSVSFWLNMDDLLIGDGSISQTFLHLYIDASNALRLTHSEGSGGGTLVFVNKNSGTTVQKDAATKISAGNWYHVVWICSSGTLSLYINGSSSNLTTGSGFGLTTTNVIGARAANSGTMDGYLDEIGIWSRAITSDEVTELYNSGDGLAYPFGAAGTNCQINIGDAWKAVAGIQINIGDAWKAVAGIQINIGDAWKAIF